MLTWRTDLALEAAQLWRESAGEAAELPGVESCLLYTSDAADEL